MLESLVKIGGGDLPTAPHTDWEPVADILAMRRKRYLDQDGWSERDTWAQEQLNAL